MIFTSKSHRKRQSHGCDLYGENNGCGNIFGLIIGKMTTDFAMQMGKRGCLMERPLY
jgi:hypothetical protein